MIYHKGEDFKIGGCKIVRKESQAKACIVAAGITLHEAIKAYDLLQEQGIAVNVVDLYSVKPLDAVTLIEVARNSNNTIITVEDHYEQGGIGEAVTATVNNHEIKVYRLAVPTISRSGSPEELLRAAQISAHAIVKIVKFV
jgi:transketolase